MQLLKQKKRQKIPNSVKDFVVGEKYKVNGLVYEVINVSDSSIECRLNKTIKHFPKVMLCGAFAAIYFGKPLFYSSKIVRGDEYEFER